MIFPDRTLPYPSCYGGVYTVSCKHPEYVSESLLMLTCKWKRDVLTVKYNYYFSLR